MKEVQEFKAALTRRFFLRVHMALILGSVFLVGAMAGRGLLWLGLESLLIRHLIMVSVSYLAFFGMVRLWFAYICRSGNSTSSNTLDVLDVVDAPLTLSPDFVPGALHSDPGFSGGGGRFGGGGATGSWESPSTNVSVPESSTSVVDAVDVDAGGVVLVVFAVAAVVIFGAGAWMIYEAPLILVEAAFELALAAGLTRATKKAGEEADWMGAIFRSTWKPLAVVVLAVVIVDVFAGVKCPEAKRLREVPDLCFSP